MTISRAQALAKYGISTDAITYEERTSNTQLTITDNAKTINITTAFATQTIASVTTLPDGWSVNYCNSGNSAITIDPSGSEQINSAATLSVLPNTAYKISKISTGFFAFPLNKTSMNTISTDLNLEASNPTSGLPVTLKVKDITGPAVIGRSTGSSGDVGTVSTPMISLIEGTVADAKTALGVTPITNVTVQNIDAAASLMINLNSGHVIKINHNADISTLAFSNVPASCTIVLVLTKDSSETLRSITWPSSVNWESNGPPVLGTAQHICVVYLTTVNDGTVWKGSGKVYYNNKLWGCGANDYGQLGLGDVTNRSSPVQVGSLTNWYKIQGWYTFLSIKTDNTLWAWGSNQYRQLCTGDNINRSSPVQIGTKSDWKDISGGDPFIVGLKNDGTLWSWGTASSYGHLGLGNNTDYSSPVQIGNLTNWSKIHCGYQHTLAIKTDGTLWSWGRNYNGCLGVGDTINYSSPIQIGSSTTWTSICGATYSSTAIKSDNTLWSWGSNPYGMLGLNMYDYDFTNTPRQIGGSWAKVSCVITDHMLGLKTDGSLWSWGRNNYGQLGLGDISNRSTPVQIGLNTNWIDIFANAGSSYAIKSDRTLWSWGNNGAGQLGIGNTINYSSPIQIGNLGLRDYLCRTVGCLFIIRGT